MLHYSFENHEYNHLQNGGSGCDELMAPIYFADLQTPCNSWVGVQAAYSSQAEAAAYVLHHLAKLPNGMVPANICSMLKGTTAKGRLTSQLLRCRSFPVRNILVR